MNLTKSFRFRFGIKALLAVTVLAAISIFLVRQSGSANRSPIELAKEAILERVDRPGRRRPTEFGPPSEWSIIHHEDGSVQVNGTCMCYSVLSEYRKHQFSVLIKDGRVVAKYMSFVSKR